MHCRIIEKYPNIKGIPICKGFGRLRNKETVSFIKIFFEETTVKRRKNFLEYKDALGEKEKQKIPKTYYEAKKK